MGRPIERDPGASGARADASRTDANRADAGRAEGTIAGLRLRLARWAILWEQLWPALWPATFTAGLFLAFALFDLFALMPGWLHLIALLAFFGAFAGALYRGLSRIRVPDTAAARRRIERESGLDHRPLTALEDRLASGQGDPEAAALWQAYQRRLRAGLGRLRVGIPRAGLARYDPWGLRAALGLVLVIALTAAAGDGWNRLLRAATPNLAGAAQDTAPKLTLWVTPPAYTRIAPLFVDPSREPTEALKVPEGSRLLAQVEGGRGQPRLTVGETVADFAEIGDGTYRTETQILEGDRLTVEQQGQALGSWPLIVIPDQPPTVALAAPPAQTERAALRLEFEAGDDYGLKGVRAIIERAGPAAPARPGPGQQPIELTLPLPGVDLKEARAASYHDLTPHPWAGLPVELRIEARDSADQTGTSAPVTITLPERVFHHPVARAIIEQRKRLSVAPEEQRGVARALAGIAAMPSAYDHDIVVALALRIAQRRLESDATGALIPDVQSLLWETALRLEDGNLSIAERELREAQRALQEALAGDATDEEIERLMDELQQALERFLEALAEQMQERLAEGQEPMPLDPNGNVLQQEDLQRLIDQAREMARSGARDAARELLAQLQEMLENLQAGIFAEQQSGPAAEAMQMMQDLQNLTRRQQELLDRSFRESRQMQPGERTQNGSSAAQDQEALRRALGDLMRRFGEMTGDIPRPLGRGEQAMRDAVEALEQGMPGGAVGPQTRALDELQQAMGAMAETLAERFGRQPGQGQGQGRFGQMPRDPLGRTNQPGRGMIDTGDVEIPEKADLQRAREILDELRRRAGQMQRPRLEREYIDRLLRQF
jgi:uncharacterized protein (TIGR02302 family)